MLDRPRVLFVWRGYPDTLGVRSSYGQGAIVFVTTDTASHQAILPDVTHGTVDNGASKRPIVTLCTDHTCRTTHGVNLKWHS
jgi:hypothetical protein